MRWSFLWVAAMLFYAMTPAVAQNVQQRDVMVNGKLTPGFDEGVNSSGGITNFVTPNLSDSPQKMSCLPGQSWCAVWVSWGPFVNPSWPGTDISPYATMLVEMRGDTSKTISIGVKDNLQPDDGTEQKVQVLLTTDWRTYAIPLSSFSRANLTSLYLVWEFVWDANSPWTAYVRTIRHTTAAASSFSSAVNVQAFRPELWRVHGTRCSERISSDDVPMGPKRLSRQHIAGVARWGQCQFRGAQHGSVLH